ncbi:MAG: hypothetical protein H3C47_16555 [Candidatus Cloacimonetes bacterium]|nr:hypothetical protein [Candidatus Cloacimonadota bacterium]
MISKQIKSHSLWKNSLFATLFTLFGKLVGFLASLYAARQLGATVATDIAFFVFSLVGITSSFFQSYNASVLVPQCIKLKQTEGLLASRNLLSLFATRISLALLPVTALSLYFYAYLIGKISQFNPQNLQEHSLAILLILPILPLAYINDLMTHWIQIQKNFIITNFSTCFHGFSVLFCLYFFNRQLGASSLALGFLLASILQFLWLSCHLLISRQMLFWQWKSRSDLLLIKQLWVSISSLQIIACLSAWMLDYFASGLPDGQLTSLIYGRKVQELMPTLLIYPLVSSLYPRLCELALDNDKDLLNQRLLDMNRLLTSIVLPVSLFCVYHSKAIISLMYYRGNFDEQALQSASITLSILSIGTWLQGSNSILTHSLYALQEHRIYRSLILRSLSMTLALALCLYFLTPRFGITGMNLAVLLVNIIFLPLWGIYLRKVYFNQDDTLIRLIHFTKVFGAAILSILVVSKTGWNVMLQFISVMVLQIVLHIFWGSRETRLIREQLIKI